MLSGALNITDTTIMVKSIINSCPAYKKNGYKIDHRRDAFQKNIMVVPYSHILSRDDLNDEQCNKVQMSVYTSIPPPHH